MPTSQWRLRSRQILAALLATAQVERWTRLQFETAIFGAYPFGARDYLPYQMWLKERKLALAAFDAKTTIGHVETMQQSRRTKKPASPVAEGQTSLF